MCSARFSFIRVSSLSFSNSTGLWILLHLTAAGWLWRSGRIVACGLPMHRCPFIFLVAVYMTILRHFFWCVPHHSRALAVLLPPEALLMAYSSSAAGTYSCYGANFFRYFARLYEFIVEGPFIANEFTISWDANGFDDIIFTTWQAGGLVNNIHVSICCCLNFLNAWTVPVNLPMNHSNLKLRQKVWRIMRGGGIIRRRCGFIADDFSFVLKTSTKLQTIKLVHA